MSRTAPVPTRRLVAVTAAALATAAGLLLPTVTADAALPAAPAGDGWVRLAHLSPDTASVDVRLSPLGSSRVDLTLRGVAYGAVSGYAQLPSGVYTVTMVAAGAAATSKPVLTASLEVAAGTARTVAAFGRNAAISVQSFDDDLATPASGQARVRVIQASTASSSVSVATTAGLSLAKSAALGTASAYSPLPAGAASLKLSGGGRTGSATVDLADGSVASLFVLDTSTGLELRAVVDSAAIAQAPVGGVNTGGGYLAESRPLLAG